MEQNSGTLGNWKISSAAAESGDALVFRNSMPYADPDAGERSEPVAVLPAGPTSAKMAPFANKSRGILHLEHQLDEEERGGTVTNQSLEQSGQQTDQRKTNNKSNSRSIRVPAAIAEDPANDE